MHVNRTDRLSINGSYFSSYHVLQGYNFRSSDFICPVLIKGGYLIITPLINSCAPTDAAPGFQECSLLRNWFGSSAVGEPGSQVLCASGTADFLLPCVPSTSHQHSGIHTTLPHDCIPSWHSAHCNQNTCWWFLVLPSWTLPLTSPNISWLLYLETLEDNLSFCNCSVIQNKQK